jgi:hypothetical protein
MGRLEDLGIEAIKNCPNWKLESLPGPNNNGHVELYDDKENFHIDKQGVST